MNRRKTVKRKKKSSKRSGRYVYGYHVEFPRVSEAKLKRIYRVEDKLPYFDTGVLLVGKQAPRRDWDIDYDLRIKTTPRQIISRARKIDPALMKTAKIKRGKRIRWSKK